jgi:predicted DNA-binding protein (UPF0251 family)
MARPRRFRRINFMPNVTYFKPIGIRLRDLKETELTFDELESIRLSDVEKLSQLEAAEKMQIHQSTFQRNLARAREKIANALVNGQAIKIHGGVFKMPKGDKTGPEGKGPKTGRGLGYCNGNDKPGFESDQPRQGMARGPRDGQGNGSRTGRGRGQRVGRGLGRKTD